MKRKNLSIIIILAIIITACTQQNPEIPSTEADHQEANYEQEYENVTPNDKETESTPEVLPEPVMIDADFDVETNSDGSFIIKTNLPDKTELMLKLNGRGYLAQSKVYISDGMAKSERFTNKGKQLVGNYTLEVLMPIPSVQCDYVKHFIGENGEYLTGPNLEGALGSVVVKKEFNVSFFYENSTSENDNDSTYTQTSSNEKKYYRTKTGKRYHLDPQCGGKNSYQSSNISDLTPCKKCVN